MVKRYVEGRGFLEEENFKLFVCVNDEIVRPLSLIKSSLVHLKFGEQTLTWKFMSKLICFKIIINT